MAEQENVNVQEVNAQDAQEAKVFSHSEVDAMFNKKFAKLAEKHKAEMEKAVADAVAQVEEAHKVAQMNDKEKQDHEYKVMADKLAALEAEKRHNAMMREARSMLKANNISISDDILTVLVTEDAETTKNAVTAFSADFQNAVNEAVKAQLADTEPRRGSTATGMTREQIMSIKNPTERQKAISDNIHLFGDMFNGGKK